jgi:hypothetical protein
VLFFIIIIFDLATRALRTLISSIFSASHLPPEMHPHLSLFSLCWLLFSYSVDAKSYRKDKHETTCLLHADPASNVPPSPHPCMMALYSVWHTFTLNNTPLLLVDSNLCSPLVLQLDLRQPTVAVVSRGDCAFDIKTQHATEAGFAALIVVNTEDELFPFGDSHSEQVKGIPTLMIGKTFWEDRNVQQCQVQNECSEMMSVDLQYGKMIHHCIVMNK